MLAHSVNEPRIAVGVAICLDVLRPTTYVVVGGSKLSTTYKTVCMEQALQVVSVFASILHQIATTIYLYRCTTYMQVVKRRPRLPSKASLSDTPLKRASRTSPVLSTSFNAGAFLIVYSH